MVNIDKYRRFVRFIANKNGKGAYESTPEFNLNAERAVMEFTMKRFGNVHEYVQQRPVPIVGFEASQKVMDDLRHLKEIRPFNVTDGVFLLPDGSSNDAVGQLAPAYLHLSRLFYFKITQDNGVVSKSRVGFKILKDKEVDDVLSSCIVAPDVDHPFANIEGAGVRVYPENLSRVELVYLRVPTAPVWGFDLVNNREVYNASLSSDIDIPEEVMNEVAMMHLSYIGIHIREQELIAYSEQAKQSGV
jgi:hypothetical protein